MTEGASDLVLRAEGVRKSFGGVHAIDGVEFTLRRGELRCLIGPNGAGKSTFFKMLTGQLAPTSGTILYEGRDIAGRSTVEIARLGIGIKNQTPDVFDGLTVFENFWLAARFAHDGRQARRMVDEISERLALREALNTDVSELAHGQRQWVEIGMVVAREPKLVLLDEPSAGMSQEERVRTAELLKEVNRNATIVVVEHDMQFIKRIAKQVTVFHQGKVLIEEGIDEVLADEMVRKVYLGQGVVA